MGTFRYFSSSRARAYLYNPYPYIKGSEERTIDRLDKKIDSLTDNLTRRLDGTERDIKRLGRGFKEVKGDVLALSDRMTKDKEDIQVIVERVVTEKLSSQQRKPSSPPPNTAALAHDKRAEPRSSRPIGDDNDPMSFLGFDLQ